MNCAECRDNLVAYIEGLLEREESLQCEAHLETCASCRAEYAAIAKLQQRLVARGRAAAGVSIVEPVMRRVLQQQTKPERNTIMSLLLKHRWGFGLSTAAGTAAIILIIVLASPKTQATAAEVMAKGAQAVAKLTSIHLRGQLRALPADNFGIINSDSEFCPIELWKQFEPELKWRIEKPGRVAVMDGQSTVMFIKTANLAVKVPEPLKTEPDTDWLQKVANLSNTISNELDNARTKGWKLSREKKRADDGRIKDVVTIEAKSSQPDNDYLKNRFFDGADTRRIYVFDGQTALLESVKIYLHAALGNKLIFELDQIDYNQPIDSAVFQLELPANVSWFQNEMQKLPDNEKYASMTAEQAARAYFEALGRQDWTEAEKFRRFTVDDQTKQIAGGLEIVSIGTAFTPKSYPGRFVPYEIKLKSGDVRKGNLALKKDGKTGRWWDDGG
ncbi:MAG: zf-HC2 domain-containing protein [Verrucomicrobiia bacterium]